MKWFGQIVVCVVLLTQNAEAQNSTQVNLSWNAGSVFIANKKGGSYLPAFSGFFGMNGILFKKKNAVAFKTSVGFLINKYRIPSKVQNTDLQIGQNMLVLQPEVMLRAGKKIYLRCGLYFSTVLSTSVDYRYKNQGNNSINYYSNSNYYTNYYPVPLQAGVLTGMRLPFKIKNAEMSFNATLTHHATCVVEEDFYNQNLPGFEKDLVMSASVKPVSILFGIDIAVKRADKPKQHVSEE